MTFTLCTWGWWPPQVDALCYLYTVSACCRRNVPMLKKGAQENYHLHVSFPPSISALVCWHW